MKFVFWVLSIGNSGLLGAQAFVCPRSFGTVASNFVAGLSRGSPKALAPADGPARALRVRHSWRRGLAAQGEGEEPTTLSIERNRGVSDFEKTSDPVKAIVSGLTDVFVWLSGGESPSTEVPDGDDVGFGKEPLSLEELEAGIREEYAKNYLWTGDINEALYEVRMLVGAIATTTPRTVELGPEEVVDT